MSEDEFKIEVENMLAEERHKEILAKTPRFVSLQPERDLFRSRFHEHIVELSLKDFTFDPTSFAEEPVSGEVHAEKQGELEEELGERMLLDMDATPSFSGQVQVMGEGPYLYLEGDEMPSEYISKDDIVEGEIVTLAVSHYISEQDMLAINEGRFEDVQDLTDEAKKVPTLFVTLHTVTHVLADGEVRQYNRLMVPLLLDSLYFHKMDFDLEPVGEDIEVLTEAPSDITTLFKGDVFTSMRSDIESRLNYTEYDSAQFVTEYETAVEQLAQVMSIVPDDDILMLSADIAMSMTGEVIELNDATVQYDKPTIIRLLDTWRVVHGFTVIGDEGAITIVHILPDNIRSVEYFMDK